MHKRIFSYKKAVSNRNSCFSFKQKIWLIENGTDCVNYGIMEVLSNHYREIVDYQNSTVIVYAAKMFDPSKISKETNCIKILI